MHSPPARYLILIEASGAMTARLFDAQRRHLSDLDAATEEVPDLIAGLSAERGADEREWGPALAGHSAAERAAAQVYTLPV
jgi:hypothetical protein